MTDVHAMTDLRVIQGELERLRRENKALRLAKGWSSEELESVLKRLEWGFNLVRCPVCCGFEKDQGERDHHHNTTCPVPAVLSLLKSAPASPSPATRAFDPDSDHLGDLVAPIPQPTPEQIKVGVIAIDEYYNGTKDAPFEGSVALVYRAMKALEPAYPSPEGWQPTDTDYEHAQGVAWQQWKSHKLGDSDAHFKALDDALQHFVGMLELRSMSPKDGQNGWRDDMENAPKGYLCPTCGRQFPAPPSASKE